MVLKNLDHIQIVVSNLDTAKAFFTEMLGFTVMGEQDLQGEWLSDLIGLKNVHARLAQLVLPGAKTHLHVVEYISPRSEPVANIHQENAMGFRHIAFEVENIQEIVDTLKKKGIKFRSEVQSYAAWGKKFVYFFAPPDDVLLELYESLDKNH